jgi:hypothetical protein
VAAQGARSGRTCRSGMVSTGQFVLHNVPAAADYVIDLLSLLVDDSDF